ncbi:MAG: MarR family transcriptional regulator [Spirochaetales bacterium]|nr:MarR family transcriptional regulator [Spirochaetales bacterium]
MAISDALKERGIEGIVPAHGQIFQFLFRESPLPLSDIVKGSGRAKSTVTGMADTLEKYGYLKRESSPDDKRSVLVSLTEKGQSLKPVFQEISEEVIGDLFGMMPEEEQIRLMKSLAALESNITNRRKE